MNDPEYILTDELGTIVTAVQTALQLKNTLAGNPAGWPVLNYQYGFVKELNETLKQYEADPAKFDKKFPLIWLPEPFTTVHGEDGIYGTAEVDFFLIINTDKTYKAADRMAANYKPILYPVRRQLLIEIAASTVFDNNIADLMNHKTTKGYYWGEAQQTVLNDSVDCLHISGLKLRINNKQDCTPSKSF